MAERYEAKCEGSRIRIDSDGSLSGLVALSEAGRRAETGRESGLDPFSTMALSDVRASGPRYPEELVGQPIDELFFSVIVNAEAGVDDLPLEQIRSIYRGEITSWSELDGRDVPIRLVSRDAESGTRVIFEDIILRGSEGPRTSTDCVTAPDGAVPRCERGGTNQVLDDVASIPGALGYVEASTAANRDPVAYADVVAMSIDRTRPEDQDLYPFRSNEWLYTWGNPAEGSLLAEFRKFLASELLLAEASGADS